MNILIIGNGFDIAHGLPTKYEDFLKLFKPGTILSSLSNGIDAARQNSNYSGCFMNLFKAHPNLLTDVDVNRVKDIEERLKNNVWARYYAKCEAEINGWIDFEREMLPAIRLFQKVFTYERKIYSKDMNKEDVIQMSFIDEVLHRKAELFPLFFSNIAGKSIEIKKDYCGSKYGVYKDKILDILRNGMDDFANCFKDYLVEVVDKIEICEDKVINSIKADTVISFNYTKTESKYSHLKKANKIYIHGDIDKLEGIVIGVNSVPDDTNHDFIWFEKSFQRLRRKTNMNYKKVFTCADGYGGDAFVNLIIYGHSLDVTDSDILTPFFENAGRVIIYYYDDADYEKKMINLIKLLRLEVVENYIYNNMIVFKSTKEELTAYDLK